ncbi:hypothetical protein EDF88_3074 [Buttiauxella sp. BIGb0552]|nr:hypothetical protein EDF88_3074 [Buttiauxella sp. BIGb0552]
MTSPGQMFVYVLVVIAYVFPMTKIIMRAGFRPLLSLLLFIPVVNILTLYYFAFTRWPNQDK